MPIAKITRPCRGRSCRDRPDVAIHQSSIVAHASWPREVWKEIPSPWVAPRTGKTRLKAVGAAVDPCCRPASRAWLDGDPPRRQISERRRRRRPIGPLPTLPRSRGRVGRGTLWGRIRRGVGRGRGRNGGRCVCKRRRAGGSRLIGPDRRECSQPEEDAEQKPDPAEPGRERGADQKYRREGERGGDAKKAVARRDSYNADKADVPVSKSQDGRQDEWPAGGDG